MKRGPKPGPPGMEPKRSGTHWERTPSQLTESEKCQTWDALLLAPDGPAKVEWKCQVKQWEVRAGREVERQLIADAERERGSRGNHTEGRQ